MTDIPSRYSDLLNFPPNSVKIFSYKESAYIVQPENFRIFKAKPEMFIDSGLYEKAISGLSHVQYNQFHDEFRDSITCDITAVPERTKNKGYHIVVGLTNACNLSCVYCYRQNELNVENQSMKIETANKFISRILDVDKLNEIDSPTIDITFFGGEPLLELGIIKHIVKGINEKATNHKVKYHISTNGTLLNPDVVKYLQDNNFLVQISIDGDESLQNRKRPYVDGRGTYIDIMRNIENIDFARMHPTLSISVTTDSISTMHQQIKNYHEMGFDRFNLMMVLDDVKGNINLTYESLPELEEMYFKIYDYYIECKLRGENISISPLTDRIYRINTRKGEPFCGVPENTLAVDFNGDIFPCQRFLSLDNFKIGNIDPYTIDIEAVAHHKENGMFKYWPQRCKNCWLKSHCGGKCMYYNSGISNTSRTDIDCYLSNILYDVAMRTYIKIRLEYPEILNR